MYSFFNITIYCAYIIYNLPLKSLNSYTFKMYTITSKIKTVTKAFK